MALRGLILLLCLGFIHARLQHLSCQHIRQFVDGHNARRLLLARGLVERQPAASRMYTMVWDEELATKAAKWAENNVFQHNPDRTLGSKRFKTGENIYIYSTTDHKFEFNPDMAMQSWFSEYRYYTFKPLTISDFTGPNGVGHYTQMAWADTSRIGCAISRFRKGNFNKYLVVCNYGPAGNFIGETLYPTGNAANMLVCDGDCSRKYGNSC